jgi:hypothetical protein
LSCRARNFLFCCFATGAFICFNTFLKVSAVQSVSRSIECINIHINEVCMKKIYIVLLVCMVFFIGRAVMIEDSVEDEKISQPQKKTVEEKRTGSQKKAVGGQSAEQEILPQVNEDVKQETARESRPVERRPVERTRRQPVPRESSFEREDREKELSEEQHEKKVEELSELLDKITDEYFDSDEEELDYDTLLERLRDELPEETRYDIPEEILEEIDWWTK